jgi:hypothetical protein
LREIIEHIKGKLAANNHELLNLSGLAIYIACDSVYN